MLQREAIIADLRQSLRRIEGYKEGNSERLIERLERGCLPFGVGELMIVWGGLARGEVHEFGSTLSRDFVSAMGALCGLLSHLESEQLISVGEPASQCGYGRFLRAVYLILGCRHGGSFAYRRLV